MAKQSQMIMVVGVALLAIVAVVFLMGGSDLSSVGQKAEGGDGQVDLDTCESSTTPDLDINAYDIRNVGTAVTEGTNLYRKVGEVAWTTFTQGTAIQNLEKGQQYEIVMGITTSDFTDNAYGKYFVSDPIPCQELKTMDVPVANDEIETGVVATFFDADGNAGAETFVADQTQTVSLKLLAGSDEFFGNPFIAESGIAGPQRAEYPNVVCLDLNSTAWDAPEKVSFKGVEMKRVSTPLRHTPVATDITYCYEAPVIDDLTMESDRYLLRLNADASTAPAMDDVASIYAANFYINAETGEVEWGVENEDGTAVGTDAADTVTLDFTA